MKMNNSRSCSHLMHPHQLTLTYLRFPLPSSPLTLYLSSLFSLSPLPYLMPQSFTCPPFSSSFTLLPFPLSLPLPVPPPFSLPPLHLSPSPLFHLSLSSPSFPLLFNTTTFRYLSLPPSLSPFPLPSVTLAANLPHSLESFSS